MGNQTHVYIWNRNFFNNEEDALAFYNSPEYNRYSDDDANKVAFVTQFLNRTADVTITSGILVNTFFESALTYNKDSCDFYQIMNDIIQLTDTRDNYYIYTESDR